jgi:hypothetical protein
MAANPGALRRAAARFVAATQSAESLRASALAGQPTPLTHPELLQPGELLPGVSAVEFAARRDRLAALLPPGGIAVLPAAPLVYMSGEPTLRLVKYNPG